MLTDQQREMARYLNISPDCDDPKWIELIEDMIQLQAEQGKEAVTRRMGEMFNEPAPTLRDVMRELADLKRMVAKLHKE